MNLEEKVNNEILSEPRFADERTLLSAKRVVPLAEIKRKQRRGQRLTLVGVTATALLVGALTTGLVVKSERRNQPASGPEPTAIGEPSEAPIPTAAGGAADGAVVSESSPLPAKTKEETKVSRVVTRSSSSRSSRPSSSATRKEPDESDEAQTATREEWSSWEERREARRVARREAIREMQRGDRRARRVLRQGSSDPSDDLFRIGDIFEGRRRRERSPE
jgi:hypothetical protein